MNRDVLVKVAERSQEQRWVGQDVVADHEVGRRELDLCEEIVEHGRSLQGGAFGIRTASTQIRTPIQRIGVHSAYISGTVVKSHPKHASRRVPDIAWLPASDRCRADVRPTRVRASGIDRIFCDECRHGDVWDLASRNALIQGEKPLHRRLVREGQRAGVALGPLRGANRGVGDAIVGIALPVEEPLDWVSSLVEPLTWEGALHHFI